MDSEQATHTSASGAKSQDLALSITILNSLPPPDQDAHDMTLMFEELNIEDNQTQGHQDHQESVGIYNANIGINISQLSGTWMGPQANFFRAAILDAFAMLKVVQRLMHSNKNWINAVQRVYMGKNTTYWLSPSILDKLCAPQRFVIDPRTYTGDQASRRPGLPSGKIQILFASGPYTGAPVIPLAWYNPKYHSIVFRVDDYVTNFLGNTLLSQTRVLIGRNVDDVGRIITAIAAHELMHALLGVGDAILPNQNSFRPIYVYGSELCRKLALSQTSNNLARDNADSITYFCVLVYLTDKYPGLNFLEKDGIIRPRAPFRL